MEIFKYALNDLPQFNNLKELVRLRESFDNTVAFKYKENKRIKTKSAVEFREDIDSLGTYLFDLGLKNGKVALIGENSYEWILSYFAVVNGGNIIVPIDKELSDDEIVALIEKCGVEAVIYSDTYSDVANRIASVKLLNMNDFGECISTGKNLIDDGKREFIDYVVDDNALCSIIYTSGTTGVSKGVKRGVTPLALKFRICPHWGAKLFGSI